MKNLSEYICESKSIKECNIDFGVFSNFVSEWVLSDDGYNTGQKDEQAMQAYDAMIDALRPCVRDYKSVIKALYNYCIGFVAKLNECGVYDLNDSLMRLLYEKICSMPANKIEKMLGAGEEGCVVEMSDKVIKIFFGDKIPSDKRKFYEECKKGTYTVFPKVYKIGKGYVVMEKLKMYTPKCDEYQYIIDKYYTKVYDDDYSIDELQGEEREALVWMSEVKKAISEVTKFADLGDLDEKNFGEREDGSIVYFDI